MPKWHDQRELAVSAEAAKSKPALTAERWQEIKDLLAKAIQLPAGDRAAYLDSVCQGDTVLRAELESLVAAHEIADQGHFEQSVLPTDLREDVSFSTARISDLTGKRVGAYCIEAEIGHGGMGKVYRARRADDRFSKEVAIKFLDSGARSERSLQLFRHEREILATLEHPNIARLLDAGESEEGHPYFVMEYVDGESIDRYCDRHRLTIEQRLSLFLKVCSAVHYAHQNLIIHRDIKPDNIAVTHSGEPKLLDFGVAKITDANPNARTLTAWRALTPAYASPEQLLGKPLNVATDIYSLGLVLYELLTGRYPYGDRQSAFELQHAILEEDPEQPSVAIFRPRLDEQESSTAEEIGEARQLTPEKLCSVLRRDLESILLKAARKEPAERYASVERFAEDIEHYLHGLPVLARQGTLSYRLRKFVARNRVPVATGALAFLFLILGVALVLREAHIARVQQTRAERRFNDVRKLANSLIFEIHDSILQIPGATSARRLIVQRAQEYLDGLAKESASDPSLLRELAAAYTRLGDVLGNGQNANAGDIEGALKNYHKAVELLEKLNTTNPNNRELRRELAEGYITLCLPLYDAGLATAKQRNEYDSKALRILEPLAASAPQDIAIQRDLARAYDLGASNAVAVSPDQALELYRRSLAIYERLAQLGGNNKRAHSDLAFAHKHVAAMLEKKNQPQQALEHERVALGIEEALLAQDPQNVIFRYGVTYTYNDTGWALAQLGQIDAALGYYRKSQVIRSALAAADPQDARTRAGLAYVYQCIAGLLERKKDFPQAFQARKQELEIRQALAAADHANGRLQAGLTESQANFGKAYEEIAFRSVTVEKRRLLCSQAASWLAKSLPLLEQRKASGEFDASYEPFFAAWRQALARCQVVLNGPTDK